MSVAFHRSNNVTIAEPIRHRAIRVAPEPTVPLVRGGGRTLAEELRLWRASVERRLPKTKSRVPKASPAPGVLAPEADPGRFLFAKASTAAEKWGRNVHRQAHAQIKLGQSVHWSPFHLIAAPLANCMH
jgi:hypothetical protein